jgi:hypothetical protein
MTHWASVIPTSAFYFELAGVVHLGIPPPVPRWHELNFAYLAVVDRWIQVAVEGYVAVPQKLDVEIVAEPLVTFFADVQDRRVPAEAVQNDVLAFLLRRRLYFSAVDAPDLEDLGLQRTPSWGFSGV